MAKERRLKSECVFKGKHDKRKQHNEGKHDSQSFSLLMAPKGSLDEGPK